MITRSLIPFAVVVASAAGPAFARPGKIALTIDGDENGLRKTVAHVLEQNQVRVVSEKRTAEAIDSLAIEELTERDAAALAEELHVDTVIKGDFEPRKHKLQITIFKNGKPGASFSVRVEDPDSAKFRKAVKAGMLNRLNADDKANDTEDKPNAKGKAKAKKRGDEEVADASAPEADQPSQNKAKAKQHGDEEVANPTGPRKHGDAVDHDAAEARRVGDRDTSAPNTSPKVASAADDEDPSKSSRDEAPAGVRASIEPHTARSANVAGIRVDLGASMTGRTLRFVSSVPAGPPAYKNAPVPGGRIETELYLLALAGQTNALAGLGIAGDFDQTASLTLHASDEMAVPLKVTERNYSFGVRYRIAFGHQPTSPTLAIGASYGARTFIVDRSNLMSAESLDLPDVDYQMFEPGIAFRIPLVRWFAVTAGGRAMLVTSAGAIANPDQYGPAHVLGASATAGFEVGFGSRMAVRVAGEATQFNLEFAGTGTLATSRDTDLTTIDVKRATDRYYGGAATFVLLY